MRTPIEQYIIDNVREKRKGMKISQEKIAIALGFESNSYVASIESSDPRNHECYKVNHLNEIAKLLNCSPKDFWPENPL